MNRRLLRVSAIGFVAVLMLISGCNGLLQSEPQETLTPVPDTPTHPIPGVANERLTAPSALADAHRSWLSGQSYTITERIRIRNDTETPYHSVTTVQWPGNITNGYLATNQRHQYPACEGPNQTAQLTQYAMNERVYSKVSECGQERISLLQGEDGDPADSRRFLPLEPTSYELLGTVLHQPDADDWEISNETTGSFRLSAPLSEYSGQQYSFVEGDRSVRNASITLNVTDEGFITDLRIQYTLVTDESRYTVVRTRTYDSVGETTISRPGWVPEE